MKLYGAARGSAQNLLARCVKTAWGLEVLPPLERTPSGKPYFPGHPHLHFNLSHSGPLLLCALSDFPVGVDIERVRPRRPELPRCALTGPEYARYLSLGADWPAFYTLWTRKEAWCKYTGLGLQNQWNQTPPENPFARSYAGSFWRAAVWGEEPPPAEILWMEGETPHDPAL